MGLFNTIYKAGEFELFKNYAAENRKTHPLRSLFWECTLRCNMNCLHCGSSVHKRDSSSELTEEEIVPVFESIARQRDPRSIFLNITGGEPLVRSDLCQIMQRIHALGFNWTMTTNGLLLDRACVEELQAAGLATMSISIDGVGSTHDELRQTPGSFDKIISNIEALEPDDFQVMEITTVFNKKNIHQLNELHELIKGLKAITQWRLVSCDPIGSAMENREMLLDAAEITQLLDFIVANKDTSPLTLSYGCQGFVGLKYEKEVRRSFWRCSTGINIGSILYDGAISVCPNVPRTNHTIYGNVRNDDFCTVWENGFAEFRSREQHKIGICKQCEQWEGCLGGAYHTIDPNTGEQSKCYHHMQKEAR